MPGWRKGSRVRRWLGLGGGVSLASAILSLGTHLSLTYDPWGVEGFVEARLGAVVTASAAATGPQAVLSFIKENVGIGTARKNWITAEKLTKTILFKM